jgi:hypothetical protein
MTLLPCPRREGLQPQQKLSLCTDKKLLIESKLMQGAMDSNHTPNMSKET